MGRPQSYLSMLESTANMQHHISVILEAKALEAEKSRKWLEQFVTAAYFSGNHEAQIKLTLDIHEHMVAMLTGLTKLEMGLARNLSVILGQENNEFDSATGSGLFDTGGNG